MVDTAQAGMNRVALYQNHFSQTMTNFAPLRDPTIINIERPRINIVQVEETAPLRMVTEFYPHVKGKRESCIQPQYDGSE